MSTPYQLTERASKNNAFCWMSWEPQIRWSAAQAIEDMKNNRNLVLEEKRAAGVDPLHMFGLTRTIALDPKRFSVFGRAGVEKAATHTETLRNALRQLGAQSAADLAMVAGLESGRVGALLANDIKKGRVGYGAGKNHWAEEA